MDIEAFKFLFSSISSHYASITYLTEGYNGGEFAPLCIYIKSAD